MSILEEFISIKPTSWEYCLEEKDFVFAFDGWFFSLECMIEEKKKKSAQFSRIKGLLFKICLKSYGKRVSCQLEYVGYIGGRISYVQNCEEGCPQSDHHQIGH